MYDSMRVDYGTNNTVVAVSPQMAVVELPPVNPDFASSDVMTASEGEVALATDRIAELPSNSKSHITNALSDLSLMAVSPPDPNVLVPIIGGHSSVMNTSRVQLTVFAEVHDGMGVFEVTVTLVSEPLDVNFVKNFMSSAIVSGMPGGQSPYDIEMYGVKFAVINVSVNESRQTHTGVKNMIVSKASFITGNNEQHGYGNGLYRQPGVPNTQSSQWNVCAITPSHFLESKLAGVVNGGGAPHPVVSHNVSGQVSQRLDTLNSSPGNWFTSVIQPIVGHAINSGVSIGCSSSNEPAHAAAYYGASQTLRAADGLQSRNKPRHIAAEQAVLNVLIPPQLFNDMELTNPLAVTTISHIAVAARSKPELLKPRDKDARSHIYMDTYNTQLARFNDTEKLMASLAGTVHHTLSACLNSLGLIAFDVCVMLEYDFAQGSSHVVANFIDVPIVQQGMTLSRTDEASMIKFTADRTAAIMRRLSESGVMWIIEYSYSSLAASIVRLVINDGESEREYPFSYATGYGTGHSSQLFRGDAHGRPGNSPLSDFTNTVGFVTDTLVDKIGGHYGDRNDWFQ